MRCDAMRCDAMRCDAMRCIIRIYVYSVQQFNFLAIQYPKQKKEKTVPIIIKITNMIGITTLSLRS